VISQVQPEAQLLVEALVVLEAQVLPLKPLIAFLKRIPRPKMRLPEAFLAQKLKERLLKILSAKL